MKKYKARQILITSFDLEEAIKLFKPSRAILAAAILLAATIGPAVSEVIDILDSSAFDVKYEFEVDGELPGGFELFKSITPTVSGGTMVSDTSADATDHAYFMGGASEVWGTSGITWSTGYTIETKIRVDSIADGASMAYVSYNLPVGGTGPAGWLNINPNGQIWGYSTKTDLGSNDNSDDFHVFRVAQEPGADSFSVWRDGEQLASEIAAGWSYAGIVRMLFGDAGVSGGGAYEMDYLRFTPGAYAPVPEPVGIRIVVRQMTANSSPLHGTVYAEAEGSRMVSIKTGRQSDDNGLTWTALPPVPDFTTGLPYGYRREPLTATVDPNTDRLITIVNSMDTAGLDPALVEPEISLHEYYLRYRVSEDGGRTWLFEEPIVHEGNYTQTHPFEGIEIGTNAMFLGDRGDIPIVTNSGRILVPIQATMLDEDGNFWNPTGQGTYTDVFVAQGTWIEGSWEDRGKITWTASERVQGDPSLSTRGMIEPTLAQFGDGRILMVMRGSNSGNYSLPGRRWYSVSQDDGDTWTDPQPWTYEDGQPFYSPSSMSTLIKHSSGRVFWVGNLTPHNPSGNLPRYPVVVGEVDPNTLSLKRGSVIEVDGFGPEDVGRGRLDLSHFSIIEDRQTKELVLTYPRYHNSYSEAEWATVRLAINGFEVKESVNFDYKYEMDVMPSTLDLDGNGVADFSALGDLTVDGGKLTMSTDAFLMSVSDGIWQNTINYNEGWTIETRVKVLDQTEGDIAWQIFAGAPAGSSAATLGVAADGQGWGDGSNLGTIDHNVDNTNDFHVFRIVQHPGSPSYTVWRDGELLGDDLSHTYATGNSLWFGDGSDGWSGTTEVDYFRFTPGAYDPSMPDWHEPPPPPLPREMKDSVNFLYRYEFDVDPTNPGQIDLDDNDSPDLETAGNGSITLTPQDTVIIDSGTSYSSYYHSGIYSSYNLWPNLAFNTEEGFTIEWRMKVLSDTGDLCAFALVAAAADSNEFPVLEIGDDVVLQNGANIVPDGMTVDNSNDFHTFRLVRDAADNSNIWWLWRDDELLTPLGFYTTRDYEINALYFGDIGGNYDGIVELDYFRLMPGAFAPLDAEPVAGDANRDGYVDVSDLGILATNYYTGGSFGWEDGDFTGDGNVDVSDLGILATNYGTTPGNVVVPEPSMFAGLQCLCMMGIIIAACRK